jgi:hypothetical protein
MRSLVALVGILVALVAAGGAKARPSGLSVSVASGTVRPGDQVVVRVVGAAPSRRLRIYLRTYPVVPSAQGPIRVGSVVPDARGRARLAFRLPRLAADVYRPSARVGKTLVAGHGLLSVVALPPSGFGTLGAPGCAPSSPSNGREVFGTAAGAQLWALAFAPTANGSTAALVGVVGKETKIVFKMTSGIPQVFYAVRPDGTPLEPAWVSPHLGSNWNRPGAEWGAGFDFDQTGCWQVHAGTPPWPFYGDIWFTVDS